MQNFRPHAHWKHFTENESEVAEITVFITDRIENTVGSGKYGS